MASGADRPADEEHRGGGPAPSLPIKRTHLLSDGTLIVDEVEAKDLGYFTESLKKECGSMPLNEDSLTKLLDFLGNSLITRIPADTRAPYNDTSLYHHLKLTAALANCAFQENQHGRTPESYRFALVSGDADQISSYVNQSLRLPDLRGRSSRISRASKAASAVFQNNLGPECVLFEGGGGFLALSTPSKADEYAAMAKDAFESVTEHRCTMTVSHVNVNGKDLQREFGKVWEQAISSMREKKLHPMMLQISEDLTNLCDVCRREEAVHEGRPLPTVPPRNELLCESCFKLRSETYGTWVDTVRDDRGYIGILRMDGDGVGHLLSGKGFRNLKKFMTPSRLSALSSLIHSIILKDATSEVEQAGGAIIYAGGDDLLALVPGREAFQTAINIAKTYSTSMANKAGISCGISFVRDKSPIYSALETSSQLLNRAKTEPPEEDVGAVTFMLAPAEGAATYQINKQGVYSWKHFERTMKAVDSIRQGTYARYLRSIITALSNSKLDDGKAIVKYQMARDLISWSDGERILEDIENETLRVAFSIYNTFMRD